MICPDCGGALVIGKKDDERMMVCPAKRCNGTLPLPADIEMRVLGRATAPTLPGME